MKRSRFTDEQIAYALRQVDGGTAVADVCRQMGISEATCYCRVLDDWAYQRGVLLDLFRPGKPVGHLKTSDGPASSTDARPAQHGRLSHHRMRRGDFTTS